ncbi:LacI family DNA-binding transcriptional regulator [Acidisoma sp. 7E03]
MPTLSDVARRAGVTTATVSNVIRGRGSVGAETAARVRAIVAELGYRPNLTARALAEGRAPTLALLVASIANPFYPEFARAAERCARAEGRFLIVCHTDSDPDIGLAYLDRVSAGISEGVLAMAGNIRLQDLAAVTARGVPVALVMWEESDEAIPLPAVTVDFVMAGRLAAEHLLALGHREIGIVTAGSAEGIKPHAKRLSGALAAFAAAGCPVPPERQSFTSDTIAGGYAATLALLEKAPAITAIFASNDLIAIGAMQAAAALGRRVPADLSVIGITDIQLAAQMNPSLTTVSLHAAEVAESSVRFLLDIVKTPADGTAACEGPKPVLKHRQSTAPPPASEP